MQSQPRQQQKQKKQNSLNLQTQKQDEKSLWNKKVYLVFKCVHLQGGLNPQFQFKKAFFKEAQAKAYKQTLIGLFKKFDQVIPLNLVKNQESGYLKWVQAYSSWADQFFRMSVTYDKIFNSIYVKQSKPVVPQKNGTNKTETKDSVYKNEANTIKKVIPKNVTNNSIGQSQKATTNVKTVSTVMKPTNSKNIYNKPSMKK